MNRLNKTDEYESLGTFKLHKTLRPIAFKNKVQELMEECNLTREEAERNAENMETELEAYYEKGKGLFAVDSEAVDSEATIFSPYTGLPFLQPDDSDDEIINSLALQKERIEAEMKAIIPPLIRKLAFSIADITADDTCKKQSEELLLHLHLGLIAELSEEDTELFENLPNFSDYMESPEECKRETRYMAYPTGLFIFHQKNRIFIQIENDESGKSLPLHAIATDDMHSLYHYLILVKKYIDSGELTTERKGKTVFLNFKR